MQLRNHEKLTLRQKISDYAKSIGFDLVGFSPAKIEEKYLVAFEDWLGNGREGSMEYMKKIEQRRDMTKILPDAKSVIVFGMNYFHEQAPLSRGHGRIARYAFGRDYHKVIGKKLKMVEKFIAGIVNAPSNKALKVEPTPSISQPKICHDNCITKSQGKMVGTHSESSTLADSSSQEMAMASRFFSDVPPRGGHPAQSSPLTKSYVDTGPVMERALAEQSGIGRIGKNSLLITEKFGSWVFLSEIITTLDLNLEKLAHSAADNSSRWSSPTQKSFNVCGNCTRCMTACPTGAIIAPGVVDSRLCISYLTIENKGKIPAKLAKIIKKTKRLYGCDICQEVCPHNRARQRSKIDSTSTTQSQQNSLDGLLNPIAGDSISLKKIPSTDEKFLKTFAGSPVMRAKRKGLQRTAKLFC